MMDVYVKMVQTSKYCWKIVSPSGKVMIDCIFLNDADQAKEYIKAYISSFTGWGYEVEALNEKT